MDVLADADNAGPAQLEQLMKDAKAANAALGNGTIEKYFSEGLGIHAEQQEAIKDLYLQRK